MDRDPPSEARRRFLAGTGALGAASGFGAFAPAQGAETARSASPGTSMVHIRFTLNGEPRTFELDPRVTLLDLLRERLDLTGTKKGCDRGQCGACTVLVDGRRVNSCLTLAATLDGAKVTSIEGLAPRAAPGAAPSGTRSNTRLHPVQAAFVERDAFQCGYCTPGQVMSCVALHEEARLGWASAATADVRAPGPVRLTDEEIRERMSGNLCRCGAYVNIVAAVRDTSPTRG